LTENTAQVALQLSDVERIVGDALRAGHLGAEEAVLLGHHLGDSELRAVICEGALELKRRGTGDVVTVSRNIFIPLTNLCRDRCSYCTFSKLPDSPEAKTFALEEVASLARGGCGVGCIEALFCLGDKPERAYASHRKWLAERGYAKTAEYLVDACRVAFEGGMLPHTNAGILTREEMTALRPWNASMGLMLETVSPRLRQKGMPHYYAPDKDPALRIRMHEEAGELAIPFTTGMLLGIGETVEERVETLGVIRDLQERYGHLQEVILQPFHPKPGTPMRAVTPMSDEIFAGWVAISRLLLGARMNLQAPPNLSPKTLGLLLRAGVNDWGGVSPLTLDFINPEAPWPQMLDLERQTASHGQVLRERLPAYPELVVSRPELFDPRVYTALKARSDAAGFVRNSPPTPPSKVPRKGRGQEEAA